MTISRRSTPELDALARLYYESVDDLGRFQEVGEKDMPPTYRELLAHDEHMTEALETFHACDLAVQVLESTVNETHYRRKVILKRKRDNSVVLFGIVRVTRALLAPKSATPSKPNGFRWGESSSAAKSSGASGCCRCGRSSRVTTCAGFSGLRSRKPAMGGRR